MERIQRQKKEQKMKTWEDEKLTCIHGIKEKLDYHDCPKCKEMA